MKIMIATLALLLSGSAFAQTVSDSVQLGTLPAVLVPESTVEGLCPGCGLPVTLEATFSESGQSITGAKAIALTEPGDPSDISDIITATILLTETPGSFILDIEFVSDFFPDGTPLTPGGAPIVESIPETGTVQNLGPAFTSLFDLNTPLPAINVMSDVPEPSTWAMMLVGFVGLGFAAFRRTRKDDMIVSA